MNSRIFGKLISILVFIILYTCFVHHVHTNYMEMGRDAYLAKQGARFDRLYSHEHSVAIEFIACGIIACIMFGLYELIAFGGCLIGKMLDLDRGE